MWSGATPAGFAGSPLYLVGRCKTDEKGFADGAVYEAGNECEAGNSPSDTGGEWRTQFIHTYYDRAFFIDRQPVKHHVQVFH